MSIDPSQIATAAYDESRISMIACAMLRSQGFNQTDIAARLHISQPEVSRLLTKAAREGVLRVHPTFLSTNVSEGELEAAKKEVAADFVALETKIRQRVPSEVPFRLHVITAKDSPTFFEQAAMDVAELLTGDLIVGTMWGLTVDKIINGLSRNARPTLRYDLRAIPLAGDPLFLLNLDNQQYSASALAAKLELALTGDTRSDLPSLYGVPAYVSRQLLGGEDRAAVLDDFIHSLPGHRAIFGAGGFVHRVDAVLTSVGVISDNHPQKAAAFIRERGAQHPADLPRMQATILGDFAGNLIPKRGLNKSDREFVDGLNKGWTGISLEQLLQIARKAKTTSRPGIVTIAFSAEEKAFLLRESLRRGLINHLIVDERLAHELAAADPE